MISDPFRKFPNIELVLDVHVIWIGGEMICQCSCFEFVVPIGVIDRHDKRGRLLAAQSVWERMAWGSLGGGISSEYPIRQSDDFSLAGGGVVE